jgi:hypothetical protein
MSQLYRRICLFGSVGLLLSCLVGALPGCGGDVGGTGGNGIIGSDASSDIGTDVGPLDVSDADPDAADSSDADTCQVDDDCHGGRCFGGECVEATCDDGMSNAGETDIDCGGPDCPGCPEGGVCAAGSDCTSGVCSDGTCAAPECGDGVQNGDETDVDCGGPDCPACSNLEGCLDDEDCQSGLCDARGICVSAGCGDDMHNGRETDVDCGGPDCAPCVVDEGCVQGSDCASGVCIDGECAAPSCVDGVQNGDESGVDCGGPDCSECPNQSSCTSDDDCASGTCDGGVCVATTCVDGTQNGQETDVDCGGPACAPCPTDDGCWASSDCESGVCDAGVCQPAACDDGVQNGGETDIDCGGLDCPACSNQSGCRINEDCDSGLCLTSGLCGDASCHDGVQNGDETDIDCGGTECTPCWVDQGCAAGSDCDSGVCDADICQAPVCDDGVQNGDETDVDCGGPNCAPCPNEDGCQGGVDCDSGVCAGGECVPANCFDDVQNADETDVDCGGAHCTPCEETFGCQDGSDCLSGSCDSGVCQAPTCTDSVHNGDETDVDCGGPECAACDVGDGCVIDGDCLSGMCNGTTCQAATCSDNVQNGDETDVDCGGTDCAACDNQQSCLVDADCVSGICDGDTCVDTSCTDGVLSGDETDVDCGGPDCAACDDTLGCQLDDDCQSGVCDGGVCQAPACTDSVHNGDETDVDCGGPDCAPCDDTLSCQLDSDCQSGVCERGVCQPAACSDGVLNGSETDIDCGGPDCAGCANQDSCAVDSDCQSGDCDSGTCIGATCADGSQNGNETDVDCGGPDCAACDDTLSCQLDSDCQSGVCDSGVCQAPTCSDSVHNGDETDVDCGGPDCAACPIDATCSVDGDCDSGLCENGICQDVCEDDNGDTLVVFFVDPPVLYNGINTEVTIFTSGLNDTPQNIDFIDSSGTRTTLTTFSSQQPNRIQATVPSGLSPGTYEVEVTAQSGCVGGLPGAVDVTDQVAVAVDGIEPTFGWESSPTSVTITADGNAPASDQFQATPRVYLNPVGGAGSTATELQAATFESATQLSGIVPAGLDDGEYDIIVVNPDGTVGVLTDANNDPSRGAFEVLVDAPPVIDSVDPGTWPDNEVSSGAIRGQDFRLDQSVDPTPISVECINPSGGTEAFNQAAITVDFANATADEIPFSVDMGNAAITKGSVCELTVTNTDGSFAEFAPVAISWPAGAWRLGPFQAAPDMAVARRMPAAATALPSRNQRFVYAVGGDDGTADNAMDSVEFSRLDRFGAPIGFDAVPRHSLPDGGLTLTRVIRVGEFLYAVGGYKGASAADPGATGQILRTKVLDPLNVPTIDGVSFDVTETDGLAAGTHYYRVAAVLESTSEYNPGGETLASEPLPVAVADAVDGILVPTITWDAFPEAATYRVYRSPAADVPFGQETLIAEVSDDGSQTYSLSDDGVAEISSDNPLAVGALGEWHEPDPSATIAARHSHGLTMVRDPADTDLYHIYAAGGVDDNDTALASVDRVSIAVNGPRDHTIVDAVNDAAALGEPRFEVEAAMGTSRSAPGLSDPPLLYVMGGRSAAGLTNEVDYFEVDPGGGLTNPQAFATNGLGSFAGYIGGIANSHIYMIHGENGDSNQGTTKSGVVTGSGANQAPWWSTLNTDGDIEDRFLPGRASLFGMLYVLGGLDANDAPLSTVDHAVVGATEQ